AVACSTVVPPSSTNSYTVGFFCSLILIGAHPAGNVAPGFATENGVTSGAAVIDCADAAAAAAPAMAQTTTAASRSGTVEGRMALATRRFSAKVVPLRWHTVA